MAPHTAATVVVRERHHRHHHHHHPVEGHRHNQIPTTSTSTSSLTNPFPEEAQREYPQSHKTQHNNESLHTTATTTITTTTTGVPRRNLTSPEDKKYISVEPDGDDVGVQRMSSTRSPDVDGGWAWVVFVAGFLQFFVSSGMYYSFSVFFVELLQTFGESRAKTGWIYSTNSAVHMFSGPLGGYVIVRWGPRTAVILGGLLAALGYLLTAFAPSLNVVFITYGFINAVGTSLNFTGWVIGLSTFWNRHYALVVGIAMSGSGFGVFLLGPFMERIVLQYGWRGAMLICAGLSINFCVFGATIYNIAKPLAVPKQIYKGKHTLMVGEVLFEKPTDTEKDNLTSKTKEESFGSNDPNMSSKHWKDGKDITEIPDLASQIVLGSSWSLKVSHHDKDKWERIQRWIATVRDCIRCKMSRCKLSSDNSAENEAVQKLLYSPTFWLLETSCFFSFMATTTVFAVFLDWTCWTGMSASFPHALAGSGAGDLIGRLIAGALMGRSLPPLILFSGIQLLLAITIGCAALASNGIQLIASMVGFGVACGLQSVLYALIPSQLSSGVGMANVLGYLLLVTGAGALTGPPVAGLLVDLTKSYNPVLILCTAAPAVAALFNFTAHFTAKRRQQSHNAYNSSQEQTTV